MNWKNIEKSILQNGHVETLVPHFIRKVPGVNYIRERVLTEDCDFLDLDWLFSSNRENLVILSHGLEGSSDQQYIKGMAKYFHSRGYDILAWNYRSCSGELNYRSRFYHSGDINDLEFVIKHAIEKFDYKRIHLIGFSLGGNLTLRYLGGHDKKIYSQISSAACFSVPCDLASGAKHLGKPANTIYEQHFLLTLKKKLILKRKKGQVQTINIKNALLAKNLIDFDHYVTAPLHGYRDAFDYYKKASSIFI